MPGGRWKSPNPQNPPYTTLVSSDALVNGFDPAMISLSSLVADNGMTTSANDTTLSITGTKLVFTTTTAQEFDIRAVLGFDIQNTQGGSGNQASIGLMNSTSTTILSHEVIPINTQLANVAMRVRVNPGESLYLYGFCSVPNTNSRIFVASISISGV